jgi:branched-chain amino acid transport system permease protein
MTFGQAPSVFWVGLTLGATYALIGLGWVIVFRATKVLNFATASFFVLGAYLCYWMNNTLGVNIYVAVVAAMLASGVITGVTYLMLLRPLAGAQTFSTVLMTLGVALILDNLMTAIWGATPLVMKSPLSTAPHKLLGVPVSAAQLTQVALAVAVACAMTVGLRRTRFGVHMRSAAENPLLASQSGINIVRSGAIAWAAAGAVLALGGILYASQNSVTETSETFALQALAAAFVGGLDSVPGALLGGLLLGELEAFMTQWVSGSVGDASVFAVLLVFIIFRPTGLMGTLEARRV